MTIIQQSDPLYLSSFFLSRFSGILLCLVDWVYHSGVSRSTTSRQNGVVCPWKGGVEIEVKGEKEKNVSTLIKQAHVLLSLSVSLLRSFLPFLLLIICCNFLDFSFCPIVGIINYGLSYSEIQELIVSPLSFFTGHMLLYISLL